MSKYTDVLVRDLLSKIFDKKLLNLFFIVILIQFNNSSAFNNCNHIILNYEFITIIFTFTFVIIVRWVTWQDFPVSDLFN